MATAALSGRLMSIGGVTFTEPFDCTLHVKTGMIDVTNSGTSGKWKEFIEGQGEWSLDASGNWVAADADAILAAIAAAPNAPVGLTFTPEGGTTYTGVGSFIASCDIASKTEDKVTVAITFQGTGAIA